MAGSAASIALTAAEYRRLTSWVRAGTTPQRLVRRARVVLGSASGLGSRALARREQLSRTTVRRWLARFVAKRCDGLRDRPRSGRPLGIKPKTRALVVALACSRPGDRDVPLSRYSLSELTVEVASQLEADTSAPSRSAIWRVLMRDALRPWRYRSWIFPRDTHFLELAGPVLDLYACQWQGQPLWADEYVLSADEKTSIQVRRRCHPSLPNGPHQAMRIEHEGPVLDLYACQWQGQPLWADEYVLSADEKTSIRVSSSKRLHRGSPAESMPGCRGRATAAATCWRSWLITSR